jgi:hypothetical protein
MQLAQTLVFGAQIYGAIGAGIALLFLVFGIDRIDPAARGSYSFRLLLVPGIVVLWPLVLMRWIALEASRNSATGS